MPPPVDVHAQLASIESRLAALAVGLLEARNTEPDLVAELLVRFNELLDHRNQVARMIPKQGGGD